MSDRNFPEPGVTGTPLPVYQLVPCFICFGDVEPWACPKCGGARYIRVDPETCPIYAPAPRDGGSEIGRVASFDGVEEQRK